MNADGPHRMPTTTCRCGKPLNAATEAGPDETPPNPGDLSMCFYCGYLHTFADDLTLRELTEAELDEFMRDPELTGIVQRMRRHARKIGA